MKSDQLVEVEGGPAGLGEVLFTTSTGRPAVSIALLHQPTCPTQPSTRSCRPPRGGPVSPAGPRRGSRHRATQTGPKPRPGQLEQLVASTAAADRPDPPNRSRAGDQLAGDPPFLPLLSRPTGQLPSRPVALNNRRSNLSRPRPGRLLTLPLRNGPANLLLNRPNNWSATSPGRPSFPLSRPP